jgi:hypothetical protein
MVFKLIPSYLGEKERILNFFRLKIFTEIGQDLAKLAHFENKQDMVEIMTLKSPHK